MIEIFSGVKNKKFLIQYEAVMPYRINEKFSKIIKKNERWLQRWKKY